MDKVPYDLEDEQILTKEEIKKAAQDRELKLADIKKSRQEYQAQKAAAPAPATNVDIKTDTFNF